MFGGGGCCLGGCGGGGPPGGRGGRPGGGGGGSGGVLSDRYQPPCTPLIAVSPHVGGVGRKATGVRGTRGTPAWVTCNKPQYSHLYGRHLTVYKTRMEQDII